MNGRGRLNRSADEDERRTAVFEARMTASKLGMKLKRSKPLRSRTKTSTPVPKKNVSGSENVSKLSISETGQD